MELHFSISAAQLDVLASRSNAKRIAANTRMQLGLQAFVERGLMLWLPLLAPLMLLYFFPEKRLPETYIAILICAAAYYAIWTLYIKKQLANRSKPVALQQTALDSALATTTRHRLKALEGNYVAVLTAEALTLTTPYAKQKTMPWSGFYQVQQDDDFYYLSNRYMRIFSTVYLIAKHAKDTDTVAYQAGLAYMLSRLSGYLDQPSTADNA
ncbi:hypothetical protein [Rheinheimera sp.]|uniref:hypothetical protein n=1 Tax=Rheinheimera sp. TaxID=1869214 RepID=UPI002734CEFE|nr:hypothetical protein [Rheinheimera sp.]MDP2714369.1 hypothetical protein [Rheinheimera sp.]